MGKLTFVTCFVIFFTFSLSAQYGDKYDSLQNKMALSFSMANYQQALEFGILSLDVARQELGETHIEVGNQYCNIGLMLKNLNKFDSAYWYYGQAESFFIKHKYTDTIDFVNIYNNRGSLSVTVGNYDSAIADMKTASRICNGIKTCKNSISQLTLLNNIANLFVKQNKNRDAEKILLAADELATSLNMSDQITGLLIKNTLAICYTNMNEYSHALDYLEKIEPAFIKKFGAANLNTYLIQSNMFLCYYKLGEKKKFDELGKFLFERMAKFKDKSRFFLFFNSYANMLFETGQIQEADRVYNSFVGEQEKLLGASHPETRNSLNSQVVLLMDLGQYDRAYAISAKIISTTPAVPNNYLDGLATNSFVLCLIQLDSLDKAIELGTKYFTQLKKDTAANIKEVLGALCLNLAGAWHQKGDNKKALLFIDNAIQYMGNKPSRGLIVLYEHKATLLVEEKKYDSSLAVAKQALTVIGQMNLHGGIFHRRILYNMLSTYTEMGQLLMADDRAKELLAFHQQQLTNLLDYLTPGERQMLVSNTIEDLDYILDFYLYAESKYPAKYINEFTNTLLFREGILLKTQTATNKAILQSNDSVLLAKYQRLQNLKANWIYQMQLPPAQQLNTEVMAKEMLTLEKEIQSSLKGVIENTQNWKSIADKLVPGEAYIHYYQAGNIERKNTGFVTSNNETYAVIIKKNTTPVLVRLDPEKKIAAFFSGNKGVSGVAVSMLYSETNPITGSKNIYELIWEPLEKYLGNIKRIYLRTNGDMNRISFAALPLPGKQTLMDKYIIRRLVVLTDSSFDWNTKPGKLKSILLIGDVDFNTKQKSNERSVDGPQWESLPATRQEVTTIQQLLQQKDYTSSLLTDSAATELAVKTAINNDKPGILHIASHGFFTKKRGLEQNITKLVENGVFSYTDLDYLQSGIVLAGANEYGTKSLINDDGILNAYEIQSLNFQQTDLVVMSACETGLGIIDRQEGVLGLQRAFKIAGAKYQILSLWRVQDKETQELMTNFYENLANGKTYEESFSEAQSAMKKKYDPFFWAGFVLLK